MSSKSARFGRNRVFSRRNISILLGSKPAISPQNALDSTRSGIRPQGLEKEGENQISRNSFNNL